MKPRKRKANEPSVRDKLSASFLAAFETDFEAHGVEVIEQLRTKSPEKYADIAARLIAATEPPPNGVDFSKAKTMQDIGRGLLIQTGMNPEYITDEMIELACEENSRFCDRLAAIAGRHADELASINASLERDYQ